MKSLLAEEEFAVNPQRPFLENVSPVFGSSVSFNRFNDAAPNNSPVWHYHPEIELAFISSGNGKRHIGNHISYYTSGDLVLIGPNLPHYGFTDRFTSRNHENVIQFNPDPFRHMFEKISEFVRIKELIERSRHGLTFYGKTKSRIGEITNQMVVQNTFERLLSLFSILNILALSEEFHILNVSQPTLQTSLQDHARIKVIFNHVIDNFQTDISLEEISQLLNMTTPSFCRYFKQQTGKTFTQFVNDFRITHACKLLSETSRQISDICFECGFNNFSHFNYKFKQITQLTPSEYRANFKLVISG